MDFIPNTDEQRSDMLAAVGVDTIADLFGEVPGQAALDGKLNIPDGISELAVRDKLTALSRVDRRDAISLIGAGCYDHFIPSIVRHLAGRSEFCTAYTPYQAEISQGSLQALFEFQAIICQLTGMDVANASMYDGASALAESCIMASNITKRDEFVVASTIHPDHIEVVNTYIKARGGVVSVVPFDPENGLTDIARLKGLVNDRCAAVLVQSPNFFGNIEAMGDICGIAHSAGALFVASVVEPTSLGLFMSPGDYDADIAVGEGQSFGINMSFGGPFLGFMATRERYMRQLPGRLVGRTLDVKGNEGFVLTLQAREQHIRRERAASNICTSQTLCAISAAIYMSSLGRNGFKRLAELNLQKAHYAFDRMCGLGLRPRFASPFYNEFVVEFSDIDEIYETLACQGITGGVDLGRYHESLRNCMLICVTETMSRSDIDRVITAVANVLDNKKCKAGDRESGT